MRLYPWLVSLDPGVKSAGVAVFGSDGILARAWLAEGETCFDTGMNVYDSFCEMFGFPDPWLTVHVLVSEIPQVYTPDKQKGAQKYLIDLAVVSGMFFGFLAADKDKEFRDERKKIKIEPFKWKGNVPKPVMERRIKNTLSEIVEIPRVELPKAKGTQSNVWDAVGIGLWYLKRL